MYHHIIHTHNKSNYNRANDVAGNRLLERILMNRGFFRIFGIHSFFYTCGAHELSTRAEP